MSEWKSLDSAPYMKVVEVKNDQMDSPVRATRGYIHNGNVHPNQNYFTSVYTPDIIPFPSGKLVCPTAWREIDNADGDDV